MTQEERETLCALMRQELLSHALLHDLRGSATSLMGWQELLPVVGGKAVSGLGRSVAGLVECIQLFSSAPESPPPSKPCALESVARRLDIPVQGEVEAFELDTNRLEAASWMAGATGFAVHRFTGGPGGKDKMELQIQGLPTEGIRLLFSPQSQGLLRAARKNGPVLGVCLFKEVVRGVRGDYVSKEDSGLLCLRLPIGA
jgi:hypothetical protein